MTLSEAFARWFRGYLAARAITEEDAAERLGISQPAMSNRMRLVTPFTLDELDRAVTAFGIDADVMIAEIDRLRGEKVKRARPTPLQARSTKRLPG